LFLKITRNFTRYSVFTWIVGKISPSDSRIPPLLLTSSNACMWLFNAPPTKRARPCALPISWQRYTYISMSVGNGFCGECIRSASPHMLRLRGVPRRHIFRLISYRRATCIYSYVSLTTNNTFHPDRLYALMNDSRDAIETQVYRKCFPELYDNGVPTNRWC